MIISRAAIKLNAKNQMRVAKPHVCVVGLVYYVISWVLTYLSERVMGLDVLRQAMYTLQGGEAYQEYMYNYYYDYMLNNFSIWGQLLSVAISIVLATVTVGFTIYALEVSRLRPAGVGTLFDGFSIFFRALWLNILMGIFTFLWSLLFISPGIIAAYRYRQAIYLLLDHPQWSALDCIRESKRMMVGRKWELFVLDLSFLGWALLSVVPFVSIWGAPYMEVTYANYYQALVGLPSAGSQGGTYGESNGRTEPPASDSRDERPPWEL